MKSTFIAEFTSSAKEGPRLFFAPLVGAVNAVLDELRSIDERTGMDMPTLTELKEDKMMRRAKEVVLASGDWKSATQLVRLGVEHTSDQLHRWLRNGEIFSVTHDGIEYFPSYGFDPQNNFHPHPALKKVIEQFDGTTKGWGLAFWFHSTNSFLGGKSPKEFLTTYSDQVVAAAADEAAGVAHG